MTIRENVFPHTHFYTGGDYDYEPDRVSFFMKQGREDEVKFKLICATEAEIADYLWVGALFRCKESVKKLFEFTQKTFARDFVSAGEWYNGFKNLGRSIVGLFPGVGFITLIFYDSLRHVIDHSNINKTLEAKENTYGVCFDGQILFEHPIGALRPYLDRDELVDSFAETWGNFFRSYAKQRETSDHFITGAQEYFRIVPTIHTYIVKAIIQNKVKRSVQVSLRKEGDPAPAA